MDTKLFHAYIVGGAREDARTTISEMLAPHAHLRQGNPDLVVTEHVTFTIDNARTLKEWQTLAPAGERKAYIAYADFITREAQNALLKTFEEPVPDTHIFLALPKPGVLLETLLSRVRIIDDTRDKLDLSASAKKFLNSTLSERLSTVQTLLTKEEDDEESGIVRERVVKFFDSLENFLSGDTAENSQKLTTLLELKRYLFTAGSSPRIILEALALTI